MPWQLLGQETAGMAICWKISEDLLCLFRCRLHLVYIYIYYDWLRQALHALTIWNFIFEWQRLCLEQRVLPGQSFLQGSLLAGQCMGIRIRPLCLQLSQISVQPIVILYGLNLPKLVQMT